MQLGDSIYSIPAPPVPPKSMSKQDKCHWCYPWAHRTLTRLRALCSASMSVKRPSLSSSLPGWYQTEKSKHRGSCQAQHPLSTQRLPAVTCPQAGRPWLGPPAGDLTDRSALTHAVCSHAEQVAWISADILTIYLKRKFVINTGLLRESLQPKEHTVVEGRPLE